MGLIKDLPTQYGVFTSYHKIARMEINWHDKYADIDVYSFANKEVREAGNYQLATLPFRFTPYDFPFTTEGNVLSEAYAAIKAKTEFIDAIDDL